MAASLQALLLALDCTSTIHRRAGRHAAMQSHASRTRRQAARRSKRMINGARSSTIRTTARLATISKKKRFSIVGGHRKPFVTDLEKKIRMLQQLIPNGEQHSLEGIDGLFREAADYIMCLEMKVRVMKIMVGVLSQH